MSLPSFICLGAAKSGTTTLYEILKQHPEIGVSSFKEPHFFDNDTNWDRGVDWYKQTYFSKMENKRIKGEFTPTYLSSSSSAKRIKATIGKNIKFIILLRNPVDRAYSHYLHTKRDEFEQLGFLEALADEKIRMEEINNNYNNPSFSKYSYVYQGLYATHIQAYLEHYEKEQFCVILFDDFINNTNQKVNEIVNFLGGTTNTEINYNIFSNQASKARSKTIKKLLKESSVIKKLAKRLVPSYSARQKIRNIIHAKNNKVTDKVPLTNFEREECYRKYFLMEILELEK